MIAGQRCGGKRSPVAPTHLRSFRPCRKPRRARHLSPGTRALHLRPLPPLFPQGDLVSDIWQIACLHRRVPKTNERRLPQMLRGAEQRHWCASLAARRSCTSGATGRGSIVRISAGRGRVEPDALRLPRVCRDRCESNTKCSASCHAHQSYAPIPIVLSLSHL